MLDVLLINIFRIIICSDIHALLMCRWLLPLDLLLIVLIKSEYIRLHEIVALLSQTHLLLRNFFGFMSLDQIISFFRFIEISIFYNNQKYSKFNNIFLLN